MRMSFGPDDEAFRAELNAFLDAHTPPEAQDGADFMGEYSGDEIVPAVAAAMAGDAVRPWLDDPGLPARARRPELHTGPDADLPRDDGRSPHPALGPLPRLRDRDAQPARIRQRRAEGARTGGGARRHDLVHRDERAERRLGPRGPADTRRGVRRRVRRERAEGLDLVRADRAEVLLLRPHRPVGREAPRHLAAHDRHGHARHRGAPAHAHHPQGRLRRSVLHRRARPAREPRRAAQRRLGDHPGLTRARTSGAVGRRRRALRADRRRAHRARASHRPQHAIRSCAARSRRRTSSRPVCGRSVTRASRRSPRVPRHRSTRT